MRCLCCNTLFKKTIDPKKEFCDTCTDSIRDQLAYFNPDDLPADKLADEVTKEEDL